ncbi:MAG: TIR domain-containing protein [Xanthobacteraceae bacterium]
MARIFISHASVDGEPAQRMKAWLDGIGFDKSFLDFDDQAGISPGDDWERRLYSELERSQAVILILTKHWFASKWCFAEFAQARALGKAIFAIVESPAGEQFVSNDIQHLDLTSNREGGLERLARRLREVALDAQGGFDWQKGRAPYPGLMSFEAADAAIFFGRDDEVRRAIERFNARRVQGGAKIFAVVGGSGSGKSSLLKAGVLPRIARDKENFLVLPAFRPGVDPLRELFNAFKAIDSGLSRQRFDEAVTPPAALDLIDAVRQAARAAQATVIIPIDQAEELFTRATAETRAAFFKQLSALLAADHPALAVLTLRADHLPDLQTAEGLTARFEHFLLNPMPIERLGLIVQGPARVAGLRAEDALVTAIARDAKTLDVLPLVAFTLRQLHDRYASGGVLMAIHYEALRDGPLSPLEVVVRDAAKATLDVANPSAEELAALREAFVPALVKVNDEGGFVRDEAELDALPPPAQRLLRCLADARLLVIAPDDDGTTHIEVAHEAIFRVWPLLAGWLEEEREFLIGRSRIEKAREDYARLGGGEQVKGLLSGILLERAKAWLAAHPARFSADEAAYIKASADEAQRLEAERAAERERLRQAELARAKAETERATERAETARRWQRRAIAAAAVFAVLGAIAAALGGVATKFWQTAEQARKEAQASLWLVRSRSDLHDGQVASAIEHAARAFKELPSEASRSALASAVFEVSPHLRATFDIAGNGAEAIAWGSRDAVVFAPAKVGGALRTLDLSQAGRAGADWPMPRLTRAQDGNRATVRAMRGLGSDRVVAVLDNGAVVLTERGATAGQAWTPASPAKSLQAGAHAVAIGARGTLIATASIDGDVTILECAIPAARQTAPQCRERPLADARGRAVAISPDETRIAVADANGLVSIHDRAGLRLGESIKVGGTLLALGWAAAADWLAAGNANGDIVIVDAGDPARPVIAKPSLAGAPITTLAWSSQGLDLAFACEGGPVCLWSGAVDAKGAASFTPVRRFEGHTNGVTHLAWSPDGDQVVSAAADGTLRVWSVAQDADAGFVLYAETSAQLTKVATSLDGRWLAAGAKDGSIRIWDAAAGSLSRTIRSSNESEVAALAWAQSGLLAAAHDSRGITLIPPNAAQPAQEIDIDTDQDTRIVFAQHDRSIAMPLHSDKRLVLIEVAAFGTRAQHYLEPIGSDQAPWGLAVDPSGQTLFVSYTDSDGEIRIWDLATRKPMGSMDYTLAEKRDPVAAGSLAVSRDGRWLATSGGDSYVRVYDIARKRTWRALPMDMTTDGPRAVVFSPDGSKLAALGSENRVYVWSLREDGAERYAVFGALPRRSAVADAKDRERAATWLAWIGNDAIALATTESAINVIGLDPAKWQRRIEALAPVSIASQN